MINTVYLVFSKMEKSKMSWFDSSLLFTLSTLHTSCGCFFRLTMPENGFFLATAECDFTEREEKQCGLAFCTG